MWVYNLFVTVNRRTGGLEKGATGAKATPPVNRRTGGLEKKNGNLWVLKYC